MVAFLFGFLADPRRRWNQDRRPALHVTCTNYSRLYPDRVRDALQVQVLGPVAISAGGTVVTLRRPLERGLVARLALARGVGVPDERLTADLWEGTDDRVARLRVVVSRLRRTLGEGADAVVRGEGGYRLTGDVPDLRAAAAAADRLHAANRAGDREAVRRAASEAEAQWRGPALSDLRSLPFAAAEGERLDAWRLELTGHRLRADLALGAGSELIDELTELTARHPLHEPLRGHAGGRALPRR